MDYNCRWPTYSEYVPNEWKPWTHSPYSPQPLTVGRTGYISRGPPHIFPRHHFRKRRASFERLSSPWFGNRIPHSFPYVCNPQCGMLQKDKIADELIQLPTEKNVAFNEQEFMPVDQKTDKECFSHECTSFNNSNAHHSGDNNHRYSFTQGQYGNETLTINANNEIQNLRNFEYPHLFQSGNTFHHGWSNYSAGLPVEEFRTIDNSSLPTTGGYSNQASECTFPYNSHYLNSEINSKPNEILSNDSDSAKIQSTVFENVSSVQNCENFLEQHLKPPKCSSELLSQEPIDETSLAVYHIERLLASTTPNLSIQDLNKTIIPDLDPKDFNDSCAQVYALNDVQETAKSIALGKEKLHPNPPDLILNPNDSNEYCVKVNALKDIQESAKSIAVEEVKLHPNLLIQVNSSEAINKDFNLSSNNSGDFIVNLSSLHDKTSKYLLQSTTIADEMNSNLNTYPKIKEDESNHKYLYEKGNNSWKPDRIKIPEVSDILKCNSGLSTSIVAPEADIRKVTSVNTADNENNSDSASQAPENAERLLEPLRSKKEPHMLVSDIMRQNQIIFNALSNGMVTNAENMSQMEIQKTLCKNLQTLSESLTKFFETLCTPSDSYFFHRKVNLNAETNVVPFEEMKDEKEKNVLQFSRNESSTEKAITLQMPVKKNSINDHYGDVLNTNIYPNQVESTLNSVMNYILEEPSSKEPWKLDSVFNSDFTGNNVTPENGIEFCEAQHVYDTGRKRKTKEGNKHKKSEFSKEKPLFLNQSKGNFQEPKSMVSFVQGNVKCLECERRSKKIKLCRDIQTQTEHIDSKGQDLKLEMPCCGCQSYLQAFDATGRSNVMFDSNNEQNLLVKASSGRKKRREKRHKYHLIKKRRKGPETGDFADINLEQFSSRICMQKTERNYSLRKRRLTVNDSQTGEKKDLITNGKNIIPNDFCMKELSTFPKSYQVKVCQRKSFTVTTIRRKNVRHCALDGVQKEENRHLNQNFKPAVTENYFKDSHNLPVEHELAEIRREKEIFFPNRSAEPGNPVLTSKSVPRKDIKIILSRIDQSSITDEILQSKLLCQLPQKLYQVQDKNMAKDKHDQNDEPNIARDERGQRGETSMARVKTLAMKSAYLAENNETCQLPSVSDETKFQMSFKKKTDEKNGRGPLFTYSLRQSIPRPNYSLNE